MNRAVKRWLIAFGVVAALGGGWALLTAGLHAAVRAGIETVGGEATATRVDVRDVRLSLFSGRAAIEGLTIDKPPGFDADPAFSVDRIAFHVEMGSLLRCYGCFSKECWDAKTPEPMRPA